jgi:septal ring factor EnvC (AmiA/AmiB activator)
MKLKLHFIVSFLCAVSFASSPTKMGELEAKKEKAKELQKFIESEKTAYVERESIKQDVLDELDKINADQNAIRARMEDLSAHQQELIMAKDNLELEQKRQSDLLQFEKQRLLLLYKLVYRVKRDGVLEALMSGGELKDMGTKLRVLYRTIQSRSRLAKQWEERFHRLEDSQNRLKLAQTKADSLVEELKEHELLLTSFLQRKQQILKKIVSQQNHYQIALKEYKNLSIQLKNLFESIESERDDESLSAVISKGSLPVPVENGKLRKSFGKSISEKFGTVTYQKGIEIEAEHNTPVFAVKDGIVEYEGWVKGLGNVMIIHHGGGFYTLSGNLFKTTKAKGSKVIQGETIGWVGDTGLNDKPSLYFEVRQNQKAINPMAYFTQGAKLSLAK